MDFNPLTAVCADLHGQLAGLQQSERQIAAELQWYAAVDPAALEDQRRCGEAAAEQRVADVRALDQDLQGVNARLGELAPAIGTLFNPLNWLDREQRDLRRRRAELRAARRRLEADRQARVAELEADRARTAAATDQLVRHRGFDAAGRHARLSSLRAGIAGMTSELEAATARKRRVDEVLAPLLQEMQALESRRGQAQADLDVAERLDRRLSAAGRPNDRRLIHEECERRFGTGSPRQVVGDRQRQIRQLTRDVDKTLRRVEELARTAARRVDTVVVDGNNLCYEGSRLIGLAAVEALLPPLAQVCEVVVVFDASVRRLLHVDDSALRTRLSDHAVVHVMASKRAADETVLDLAGSSEFTFVLSNDRFGDLNDKPAVRGGRIIRHAIVNGHVFVADLQLRVTYRQSADDGGAGQGTMNGMGPRRATRSATLGYDIGSSPPGQSRDP